MRSSLVARIFSKQAPDSFRPHDSSVRLKQVTVDDAATYLARFPGGLRRGYLLARKGAVQQVLVENGGNRTAAAKTLGMTRQQIQEVLREDCEDDALERKAR